jgi:hypothetical protein
MNVRELIEYLQGQPQDAEVEIVVVAPVEEDDSAITVDRYTIDALLPWINEGDDEGRPYRDRQGDDGDLSVWLIGGEPEDLESLLDELENQDDDGDD